jgi:AAA+ ATPase superfamily predicted ATPase
MKEQLNPFKAKGVAIEDNFFNREKELKELIGLAKSGNHTLLIAPRRYGKTSLLHRMSNVIKKEKIMVVEVDLFLCANLSDFVRLLGKNIIQSLDTPWEKLRLIIKKDLPRLAPKISITATGEPEFGFDIEEKKEGLAAISDWLMWLDGHEKKKKILILDEIQEIQGFDEGYAIEKGLRSIIQNLKNTTVFFSGSSPRLLREMFQEKVRAFFQSTIPYELHFTPISEAYGFLKKKFDYAKSDQHSNLAQALAEISQGHPYYVQMLGYLAFEFYLQYESWNKVTIEVILESLYKKERMYFESEISKLTSLQKNVFRALIKTPNINHQSKEFMKLHRFGNSSSVRKITLKLEEYGMLVKTENGIKASDPLLAKWWAN